MKKPTKVNELEKLVEELDNKWKRAMADYQNLEKRISAQQSFYVKIANVGLIEKLLPVIDDLERANKHLNDPGINMITKQFLQVLKSEGLERIEVVGKPFDPTTMECVEMTKGNKNQVVAELEAGYMLGETVLRPAKVAVGKDGTNTINNLEEEKHE
jgi:molecular chaperone GrpE